jgi:hypothetical protein
MSFRSWLSLGLFALGGCASFPQGPSLIGYDPAPYGDAFRAAAAEAVIRQTFGQGFYEAFGDRAYTVGLSGLCSEASLAAFVAQQRGCAILHPGDGPDCRERDTCMRLSIDSALFRDPAIRSAVETALRHPCDALTPPKGLPYRRSPSIIGKPAQASWSLLRCGGGRRVEGGPLSIQEDGARTILSFRFTLVPRGRSVDRT